MSDSVHIQAEQCGETGISPTSQPERFQTGKEAALLLVQEAVEQNDGGLEFCGRALEGGGVGKSGNEFSPLTCQNLPAVDRLPINRMRAPLADAAFPDFGLQPAESAIPSPPGPSP